MMFALPLFLLRNNIIDILILVFLLSEHWKTTYFKHQIHSLLAILKILDVIVIGKYQLCVLCYAKDPVKQGKDTKVSSSTTLAPLHEEGA